MKFSFLKKKEEQSGEYAEIPQEERAEGSIKIMVEKLQSRLEQLETSYEKILKRKENT